MSGTDKLELFHVARDAGFRTYLYFIATDSPLLNAERVAVRVSRGGHSVPPDKIISRWNRSLGQLRAAIRLSHRAYLFDNSGKTHRLVAEFENDRIVLLADQQPNWFGEFVWDRLEEK